MSKHGRKDSYLDHLEPEVLKAIDGASQLAQSMERQDLSAEVERLNILETPFYERLGKVQATALEHEYNVITSRHDKIGYAVYKDGGVPRTVEVDVVRRKTLPSLIGHRITITELAMATTRAGVQTAEETARNEKMIAVLEETEYLLFYGDRSFGTRRPDSPQNLQFDGIENIVKNGAPQNILDLKGQPISLAALWAAENKVYRTQGLARPNVVLMSPIDKINLQASFYQIARTNQAERVAGVLGTDAQTYISAYGESELVTNRFLGDWHKYNDQGFGMTGGEFSRPNNAASFTAAAQANSTGTGGLGARFAGNVEYAIKIANFSGESEARLLAAPVAVTAGQEVLLTFTCTSEAKWAILYRKDATTGGEFKFLKRVAIYATGAAITVIDDGYQTLEGAYGSFTYEVIPGTGFVAGVDFQTTMTAQWIPMEQVPLPATLNSDYAVRHVMSLFSRAPEFNFLIVNVGQDSVL
jgi:hypothetical protein